MFSVGPGYYWNIGAATLMGLQCFYAGQRVYLARVKYGVEYPDMGSGRYAAKLSDKDWKEFNNIMRTQQNYVEQLPICISSVLIGGLFYPKMSAVLGGIYILGRAVYSFGYSRFGPQGRWAGVLMVDLSLLGLMVSNLVGVYKKLTSG
ncbi:hypothetical protein BB558_006284 [Smittium angustum]|uniref:Glutathione transferase n=1 Tax=Smittium angustum TaxID=133377 RepID=A0A2U1IYE4_SMIAN|nr:hypothetical protein BB558_006284 [Smittium angustum]